MACALNSRVRGAEMSYEKIDRSNWRAFFDSTSKVLEGKPAQLEIVALDVGDQLDAEQLRLGGLTYEPSDNALYVALEGPGDAHFDHVIASPEEVYIELREDGLSQIAVIDHEGRKQFVQFQRLLALPASD